jgi:hypothetical protein
MPVQNVFNFVSDCRAAARSPDDEFGEGERNYIEVDMACGTRMAVVTLKVG